LDTDRTIINTCIDSNTVSDALQTQIFKYWSITMKNKIIRSSKQNPCPVCDRTKDGDCSQYADGQTVMCKTYADGVGHDESKWHYTGIAGTGFQGKFVLKSERVKPEFQKSPRPQSEKHYFYPDRTGGDLVRVTRRDDGAGNKTFFQSHWDGTKWLKGCPKEIRPNIPIYRYWEISQAIERKELIFIVEGEGVADRLWELGIAATTTIGGSGGYSRRYGDYSEDLEGARLVLAPDRDALGVKYIANFERDFPTQIEGYYLAGTEGLWRKPAGGMDIGDDITDHKYSKEQILDRIISTDKYRDLTAQPEPQNQEEPDSKKPHFTTSWDTGLKWETTETDADGKSEQVKKPIGNHLEAIAYCDSPDGTGAGIFIEFRTQRGKSRRALIPRGTLTGDGSEALRFLADRGYHWHRKQKSLLLDYLFGLGAEVDRVYTIADRTGWVEGSFLTPAKTYGDPDIKFQKPTVTESETPTEVRGTLAEWKNEVAAKCAGNSRLIFSLGTAFAASLLDPAQIESGGFHLTGGTSKGKTTALNVAASVSGLKHIPTWRSTANALEGQAVSFNHGLFPLDELGQADPKDVGAAAYMLANGQGKSRMLKSLTTAKPKTWELLFLSSGEFAMTDYLKQAGISVKGGMETRMPSIPAVVGEHGVFENIHGYDKPIEFVTALESSVRNHQGTALDEYLTQLVEARKAEGFDRELRERVHAIGQSLSQQYKDTAIGRVAVRFGLVRVGLELAHQFGLLPFPIEQCRWAVSQIFSDWVNARGGEGSIEIKEACNKIEYLFVTNQHSDRIADPKDPNRIIRNLLAYKIGDTVTDHLEYCVPTAVFDKEFASGVDKGQLIAELVQRGWLKPSLDNRHTLRRRIDGKQQRVYVLNQFWVSEKNTVTAVTAVTDKNNDSLTEIQPVTSVTEVEKPSVTAVTDKNNDSPIEIQPVTSVTEVKTPLVTDGSHLNAIQSKGLNPPVTTVTTVTNKNQPTKIESEVIDCDDF
jgi:putative DNA primase/helicase